MSTLPGKIQSTDISPLDTLTFTERSSSSTNPSSGALKVYAKTDGNFYSLSPSGVETQIGSGGGGLKNYLGTVNNVNGNGNFELGSTTGWSLAHSSLTSNFPSTLATAGNAFSSAGGVHGGSAANANLSLSVVSSGQLAGTYSGSYASSTATTAGDMLISNAFTIDTEDQAKVMTIKFYYSVNSGAANVNLSGTSSNSFGIAVYDVTNAAWIMPAGVWNIVQKTGSGYMTGTFQTSSNSTQYQLAFFNANASSGAVTMYVDDFFLGPQTAPLGAVETDWVSYTPTFTGLGTVTSINMMSKRRGDSLIIRGGFQSGTNTATQIQITIGFNGINNPGLSVA